MGLWPPDMVTSPYILFCCLEPLVHLQTLDSNHRFHQYALLCLLHVDVLELEPRT